MSKQNYDIITKSVEWKSKKNWLFNQKQHFLQIVNPGFNYEFTVVWQTVWCWTLSLCWASVLSSGCEFFKRLDHTKCFVQIQEQPLVMCVLYVSFLYLNACFLSFLNINLSLKCHTLCTLYLMYWDVCFIWSISFWDKTVNKWKFIHFGDLLFTITFICRMWLKHCDISWTE